MASGAFQPTFLFEAKSGFPHKQIAGVDEVGRGCIAGPVVAAAVILPASFFVHPPVWLQEVRDSKLLSASVRSKLAALISTQAVSAQISEASIAEIDSMNILRASHLAMIRSLEGLTYDIVLVDGNLVPQGLTNAVPIIKGDQKSVTIACASIIAKVYRDKLMEKWSLKYPAYGFEKHKGYPTAQHIEALISEGVSPFHRKSFAPVSACLKTKTL